MEESKHESVWFATAGGPSFPPLRGDISVDVAIVGAGITGLTAATALAEAGRSVAVLEAGRLGGGVTGGTTAEMDWPTDAGVSGLLSKYGEQTAKITIVAGLQAIDRIATWVRRYGINCEFKRVPGYYYTESPDELRELDDEVGAAQRLGFPAMRLDRAPLPFDHAGAVRYGNEALMHPLRYIYGLADHIAGERCQFYEHTRVTNVEEGTPCRVTTEHGVVLARKVVLATHSPLGLRLSVHTRVAPYRSYVVAARLAEPLADGFFFDNEEPYHYLRRLSDADPNLALIGGADHKTGQREDPEASWRELEAYARERLKVEAIERRWSAQVFVSSDDLPLIGLDAGAEHTYVATGYAGTGITLGTYAGMLIADSILGRRNAAAELFTPRRVHVVAGSRKFVSENLNVAKQFVEDYLTTGPRHRIDAIPEGEGVVAELDGKKVALYRDESSQVHKLSAVCTHARCIVRWNPAEKSWDCPCHGSRYSAMGEVIDGPALEGLERLE